MDPHLLLRDSEPRIHPTAELKSCRLGRYASIAERVILREVSVGDFSYFERHSEAAYASIGKFCSIAANTRINALEHPLERLTTHKVGYRPNEYFRGIGVDAGFLERRRGRPVTIGHDVWIGHGAVILPGVIVGNGAVIGANAVVRRDVPAFTVVASGENVVLVNVHTGQTWAMGQDAGRPIWQPVAFQGGADRAPRRTEPRKTED